MASALLEQPIQGQNGQVPSYFGKGLYSMPEAARLLRLPVQKARRWMDGYYFQTNGSEHYSQPIFRREMPDLEAEDTLTFIDLMEMHFVSLFRQHGLSAQYIRSVARKAEAEFGKSHPFVLEKFETDGHRIFATMRHEDVEGEPKSRFMSDYMKGQTVMESFVRPFLLNLEYSGEFLRRYFPLGKQKPVVLDPERAFGKPIDVQSGVPTLALAQMVSGGEPVERVAWWYEVTKEAVEAAVQYEDSLRYRLAE